MKKKIIIFVLISVFIYCASTNQINSIKKIHFGLEPVFTVAVLSLSYFEKMDVWPAEIDNLDLVTSPDSVEDLKSKFIAIQFTSHQNRNLQIDFSLKSLENDSIRIENMTGNLEINSSEIANVDSVKLKGDLEIQKMSMKHIDKSKKSIK